MRAAAVDGGRLDSDTDTRRKTGGFRSAIRSFDETTEVSGLDPANIVGLTACDASALYAVERLDQPQAAHVHADVTLVIGGRLSRGDLALTDHQRFERSERSFP